MSISRVRNIVWGLAGGSLLVSTGPAAACSVSCALSFAPGPVSWVEIAVVAPVVALVGFVFVQAFRYTLRPGEQAPEHIKWRILQEEDEPLLR